MCSNRSSRGIAALVALILIVSCAAQLPALASESQSEILLVYPDAPNEARRENLRAISEALTCMGHTVDYLSQSSAAGVLDAYASVICYDLDADMQFDAVLSAFEGRVLLLGCLPAGTPTEADHPRIVVSAGERGAVIAQNLSGAAFTALCTLDALVLPQNPEKTEGTITVGDTAYPLVSVWGDDAYIPLTDYREGLSLAVLQRQMQLWLWPYDDPPHAHAQFVVIDRIYPFTDPAVILDMVKVFIDEGVSFALSVMPIYENGDFPHMQRLCDVFRYAQANGGAVILHAPLIRGEVDSVELQERLTVATDLLIQNGVYPIALEVPVSWMYDDCLRAALGRYRTLFLYDDEEAEDAFDLSAGKNEFVTLGANLVSQAVSLNASGVSYLNCCAAAVYVDANTADLDFLASLVREVRNSLVPFGSLWYMDNVVYLNDGEYLAYQEGTLTVNGEELALAYSARPDDKDYDYNRDVFYKAAISLKSQNRFLMAFVCVAVILFIASIFLARRQMRKRFYLDREDARPPEGRGDL